MTEPKKTALHSRHLAAGAKMVSFAGFEMPVQYEGVIKEHLAVRKDVGLFDVSHMGEIFFEGTAADAAVDRLVTNHITGLDDGQAAYAGLLHEHGGFVDDVVCYKFDASKVMVCVNASNRDKDFAHMQTYHQGEARLTQRSDDWSQLAVQGPNAPALVQQFTETDLASIERYRFAQGQVDGRDCIIARTGYTGEDGFELFCQNDDAGPLWDRLTAAGAKPCGLGARDTLRLEMKYALYGNDIDDDHSPLEAGLGFIVKLDKGPFVGREALVAQKAAGLERRLVAFKLTGRGVPRAGMAVRSPGGDALGVVTSGTMSPSLKEPIGLAYVKVGHHKVGSSIEIDIRGRGVSAQVVKPPFVKK